MKFLRRNRRLITAAVIAVLVITMTVASLFASGRVSPLNELVGGALRPFRTLMTGMANGLGGLYGYLYEYESMLSENEALRLYNAQLEEALRQLETMRDENERLKELVGLIEERPDFKLVDADVISRDVSNWSRTLTLDIGSSGGVAVGDCVLSAEGYLVGVIIEAALTWCTVSTLTDTDFSAGAIVFRTGEIAVAEGRFDMMLTGRLGLFYLPGEVDLNIGDTALTSGIGGIFPKDVEIGKVASVSQERDGMSAVAELIPAVDIDRLRVCYIVTDYNKEEAP